MYVLGKVCAVLKKKKMHNLNVENYVLFCGQTKDLGLGESLLGSSKGLFQKGKGGVRTCRSFCSKPGS